MTLETPFDLDDRQRVDIWTEDTHRALARWNQQRLGPTTPNADWKKDLGVNYRMSLLEGAFIEAFRGQIAHLVADVPTGVEDFIAWFEDLKQTGPGQGDPLFAWLAESADLQQMRWFLRQEVAGEAGFDDLVAMTQIKMPVTAKLELARNYWDEMGRGNEGGMHGPMLNQLTRALDLDPTIEATVPASLALGNTLVAFAANRRYAFHSIGALGAVELTAPRRAELVAEGLKRLGVGKERRYFALHATLDVKHSEDWNREVLRPLVSENPGVAQSIAEGAIMRLECGRRCFEAYRAKLWAVAPERPILTDMSGQSPGIPLFEAEPGPSASIH